MIYSLKKYRVAYGTVPTKEEIEYLIESIKTTQSDNHNIGNIIVLEYGFPIKYYSMAEQGIRTGYKIDTIDITIDSYIDEIISKITKLKEECEYQNSKPIPV